MAGPTGHGQNKTGAGGGTTSSMGEFTTKKPQNPTTTARRIYMHHALYLPDLCKGLRNYHLKVLHSLEAGDPTYHAVQSLWDDAGNFSEPESEEEEMEVA